MAPPRATSPTGWQRLCRLLTSVFYHRVEVTGLERVPSDGPAIVCANHVNALADAVVVQSALPRMAHPIARSGLFRRPWLRPLLDWIEAVPIARRRPGADPTRNDDAFARCHEHLESDRMLLIFPEGQSHSDPSLRPIKTGAARLALAHRERTGRDLTVLPVGLLFPDKGRFRSKALVQIGRPIEIDTGSEKGEDAVRSLTRRIQEGLADVTLNADSWRDVALMRHLDEFFDLSVHRETSEKIGTLRALQRLSAIQRWLRVRAPAEMDALWKKVDRFARLCRRHGVRSHHPEIRYRPIPVLRFVLRSLAFALLVVPIALWGLLHSGVAYFATRWASAAAARGRDQYDSAGMLFGLGFFLLFWGLQTSAVGWLLGPREAALYASSLPITALVALFVARERKRILDEVRIFLVFMRRRELQRVIAERRNELEEDITRMAARVREELGEDGLQDLIRQSTVPTPDDSESPPGAWRRPC